MADQFVCVCNRDRDSYQVPLALHEAGLLAAFVTDYYTPDSLPRWLPRPLLNRRIDGLPRGATRSVRRVALVQYAAQALRVPMGPIYRLVDRWLSRRASRLARRHGAGLYCYHTYLPADPPADRPLIVFVYHPLPQSDYPLLAADQALYPEAAGSFELEGSELRRFRLPIPWSRPDAVVCASSFTAKSLIEDGCSPDKITIIPYGLPDRDKRHTPPGRGPVCRFVFVGQGVQRKGIHHLIRAWQAAPRPGAELTIVSYAIDPKISALVDSDTIKLLGYQQRADLEAILARSDVFVMPSLIEGFGLVYLEALSHGLHVIGTPNTGLPDLGLDDQALTLVPVGDLAALGGEIDRVIGRWRAGEFDKASIAAQGARWTQAHFRHSIAAHANAVLAGIGRIAHRGGDKPRQAR